MEDMNTSIAYDLFWSVEATNTTDNASSSTTTTATTTVASPSTKLVTFREPVKFQIELRDYADPSAEARAASVKK